MLTSVALSLHFESLIQKLIKSGHYNNASEVVRAGLRLLEDEHARARLQHEEPRSAIAAGLASGQRQPADAVFNRLNAKYRKLAGKRAA